MPASEGSNCILPVDVTTKKFGDYIIKLHSSETKDVSHGMRLIKSRNSLIL